MAMPLREPMIKTMIKTFITAQKDGKYLHEPPFIYIFAV